MYKNIVIAFVTPKTKKASFEKGLKLAQKFDTGLTLIECLYKSPSKFFFFDTKSDKSARDKQKKQAEQTLDEFKVLAEKSDVKVKTKITFTDSVSEWVIEFVASNKVDLLIIDHPHLSEIEESFYHDLLNAIHHEVKCDVLTIQ